MAKSARPRTISSSVAALGLLFCAGCQAANGADSDQDSCPTGKDCASEHPCDGGDCTNAPSRPTDPSDGAAHEDEPTADDVEDVPTLEVVAGSDAGGDDDLSEPESSADAGPSSSNDDDETGIPTTPGVDAGPSPSVSDAGNADAGAVDAGSVDGADGGTDDDAGNVGPVEVAEAGAPDAGDLPVVPSPCNSGTFSTPELINDLDVVGQYWAPAWSPDGLVLYFAASGNGLTNPDFGEAIFRATRDDRESPFGPAEPVTELNGAEQQGSPHLSADGKSLFLFIEGDYSRDLYSATLAPTTGLWTSLTRVPTVNANADDYLPWLNADGSELYFTSARFAGEGEDDLWVSTRTLDGFETPVALTALNSSAPEESPSLSPDELTIYFTSERGGTDTRFRVYTATRDSKTDDFAGAVVVAELSESADTQQLALSRDGREMLLASNRNDEQRLWLSRRECPEPTEPIAVPTEPIAVPAAVRATP